MKNYIRKVVAEFFDDKWKDIDREIEFIHKELKTLCERLEQLEKKFEQYENDMEIWQEDIRNNHAEMQRQKQLMDKFTENIRNNNVKIDTYSVNLRNNNNLMQSHIGTFESYTINLRNNNQLMQLLESSVSGLKQQMDFLERGLINLEKKYSRNEQASCVTRRDKPVQASLETETLKYRSIDYLDFESHFRGSRFEITERQKQYLSYYKGCKNVIDIGCGCGEFLELLENNDIVGVGVDTYEDFVVYCHTLGLNAVLDDGIHYLKTVNGTDGLFLGQVVEHLTIEQILELCDLAYEKLERSRYIVIETPNPTSLAIYANAFYVDPSHTRPVHPLTLEYFLRKSGFRNIRIVYTENSRLAGIPSLKGEAIENLNEFNHAIQKASDMLFGSQDYAVIAQKD
ncbi:MAG: class I SAM-dependent methyltransferase [Lachnospiraceae bacterium]|jgi:sRNA-binding regulator protein Hfq|nr:class I SAM-dependent methyltransferase [Lachnospiraceae bacterium]